MTQERGSMLFLGGLLAVLAAALLWMAWPFLSSFVLAAMIAAVLHPLNQRLASRLGSLPWATFVTTLAAVLLLGGLCALALITLTPELGAAYDELSRRSLAEGGWPALLLHAADRAVDLLATHLPLDKAAIRGELIGRMRDLSGYLLGHLDLALSVVVTLVATTLLVSLFLYFLLLYGRAWTVRLAALLPLDHRSTQRILAAAHDSVVANLNGMLAVVVGQGVLLTVGFALTGVRSPWLWGAVGGLASAIPVMGAPLVWVPVAVGFLVMGSYGKALVMALWGSLIVGSLDNIVRPWVVGSREKLHPIVVGLAAIGGTFSFGPLGILWGPLVVSLFVAVQKELQLLTAAQRDATHQ
ncbi:MAG: AI-2E family transporter [Bryobacteraceae bacterium]|nr:AI-2E family transporter [Bryobacteraceae bacterium]